MILVPTLYTWAFPRTKPQTFVLANTKNTVKQDSRENYFCNQNYDPHLSLYLICHVVILFPVSLDLIRTLVVKVTKAEHSPALSWLMAHVSCACYPRLGGRGGGCLFMVNCSHLPYILLVLGFENRNKFFSSLERGLVGTGRIQSLLSYVPGLTSCFISQDWLLYFSGLLRLTLFILILSSNKILSAVCCTTLVSKNRGTLYQKHKRNKMPLLCRIFIGLPKSLTETVVLFHEVREKTVKFCLLLPGNKVSDLSCILSNKIFFADMSIIHRHKNHDIFLKDHTEYSSSQGLTKHWGTWHLQVLTLAALNLCHGVSSPAGLLNPGLWLSPSEKLNHKRRG